MTPSIDNRLAASLRAQDMGFEIRWRVDPIMPVEGWRDIYGLFFNEAAEAGHAPTRITLGTYRETQPSLHKFTGGWGLPRMEWAPTGLEKDGMHYHMSATQRIEIYRALAASISSAWHGRSRVPIVALCKEPNAVRMEVGLDHDMCNCGP